jgi:uncharacterized protein (DUF2252 family)
MHASIRERAQTGKAARAQTPRSSQATLDLSAQRDPLGLLAAQDRSRLAELVPLRYERMRASPLAFFRGASVVMANDLSATPASGFPVQLSGDAHLLNFGGFASPERELVFDLNDFDETLRGPFEWDLKRLVTSFEIAGRDRGLDDGEREVAVRTAARTYRKTMRRLARMGNLDVWYARLDARGVEAELKRRASRKLRRRFRKDEAKAYKRDRLLATTKLTHAVNGTRRFVARPPLLIPLEDAGLEPLLHELFRSYLRSLPTERRTLLERFRYADLARKVVGVGSVGTRCWVLLLLGRDVRDPLLLQVKEAQASVLEPVLGTSECATHGQRIVEGQLLIQAASDIFLGWAQSDHELAGGTCDYYVRQLWDWKISVDLETISARGLAAYARACGWTLARAHARSGDRVAIAAYLGAGDSFDRGVATFAEAYADLNERDHRTLAAAAASDPRRARLPG